MYIYIIICYIIEAKSLHRKNNSLESLIIGEAKPGFDEGSLINRHTYSVPL